MPWYVVFDPAHHISDDALTVFERERTSYIVREQRNLDGVGLGLTLWEGAYEGVTEVWLRWTDRDGSLLLTGSERAQSEALRAQSEAQRASAEAQRANFEAQHAARLAEKLRELGVDPDSLR